MRIESGEAGWAGRVWRLKIAVTTASAIRHTLPLLVAACLATGAGCTTKAKARAQAEKAFQAGLQQAPQAPPVQQPVVTILGQVRQRFVPWREGLTLREAIHEATYTGLRDPRMIRLIRGAEWVDIHPNDLLRGAANPEVEAGDVIELR